MKVSRFQKWKKTLPQQIAYFSTEADKDIGDDEWEMPIHRHSAAEILVWIIDKAGATLRKSQLVEAWFSIVRKCWNLMDIDQYGDRNRQAILSEIEYYMKKMQYKKNEEVEVLLAQRERERRARSSPSLYSFWSS